MNEQDNKRVCLLEERLNCYPSEKQAAEIYADFIIKKGYNPKDLEVEIKEYHHEEIYAYGSAAWTEKYMRIYKRPGVTPEIPQNTLAQWQKEQDNKGKDRIPSIKGYLVRDRKCGDVSDLYFAQHTPAREEAEGEWLDLGEFMALPKRMFPEIKWESEPVEVVLEIKPKIANR